MLRIISDTTADTRNGSGALLRLEGQVTGPWVEELRRVCDERMSTRGEGTSLLVLDMTNVLFVDPDGIALLRQLSARHVSLTNCSVFVAEQLKEVTNGDD